MSDTMVKRVARALSEAGCAADWNNALEGARAAIEAMREPTDDMLDHPSYTGGEWSRRNVEAWIDAALAPSL